MSWKTMSEIAVWMIAAAAIGILIGFAIGVISKAAKSLWSRNHQIRVEKAQLVASHEAALEKLRNKIDGLNKDLLAEQRQTVLWQKSHEQFREEFTRMSKLSLSSFENLGDLRNHYDEIWGELQKVREKDLRELPLGSN